MFAGDFYFGRERDGGGSLATVVRSRSISSGAPRNPIAFRRNTPGRNTVGCHVKESNTVSEERSSDTIERPRDAECGIAINRLTTGELKIHMEKADARSIMQEAPHVAFILVAFGYILTWTFLGSLIKYFTAKFGAQFFVYMNVAFYIVGYPTSYCQKVYDTMYDVKYTANVTYQARGILCLLAMTGCVILIPPATEDESGAAVLALTAIIGVLTWAMHGIATCLASVIKYDSPTYQQIGFMLPGFYCLAFILSQNYGEETTTDQLWLPFGTTAGCVLLSLAAWLYIISTGIGMRRLDDLTEYSMNLSMAVRDRGESWKKIMGRLLTPSESFSGDSREGSRQPSATHTLDEAFTRPHSQSSAQQQTRQDKSTNPIHDQAVKSSQSKPLQLNEPLTEGESESAEGLDLVPYQLALFLTLFASILEGSFLSYVKSSAGSTETLSEMLYFIRIFSDLAGRPFTFLYIPPALEKVDGIVLASKARCSLLFLFAFYVIIGPRIGFVSDPFISVLQFVLSFTSGYLSTLVFRLASLEEAQEGKRLINSQRLNLTFQLAVGSAVLVSLPVVFIAEYA